MMLITKAINAKLVANYTAHCEAEAKGHSAEVSPPLKLFNPSGAATWLISERDTSEPDQLFGLCDLGFGSPELGWVSLSELEAVKGPFGLGIERDRWFEPKMTMGEYTAAAKDAGRITA